MSHSVPGQPLQRRICRHRVKTDPYHRLVHHSSPRETAGQRAGRVLCAHSCGVQIVRHETVEPDLAGRGIEEGVAKRAGAQHATAQRGGHERVGIRAGRARCPARYGWTRARPPDAPFRCATPAWARYVTSGGQAERYAVARTTSMTTGWSVGGSGVSDVTVRVVLRDARMGAKVRVILMWMSGDVAPGARLNTG